MLRQRKIRRANPLPTIFAYVFIHRVSTGKPKGVEITQRSLLNHNFAVAEAYDLRPEDRVLQFSPVSFDILGRGDFPQPAAWLRDRIARRRNAIRHATFMIHRARAVDRPQSAHRLLARTRRLSPKPRSMPPSVRLCDYRGKKRQTKHGAAGNSASARRSNSSTLMARLRRRLSPPCTRRV